MTNVPTLQELNNISSTPVFAHQHLLLRFANGRLGKGAYPELNLLRMANYIVEGEPPQLSLYGQLVVAEIRRRAKSGQ